MDKATKEKLIKAGFSVDGEDHKFCKFDGNREYYVVFKNEKYHQTFCWSPVDENEEVIEDDSDIKEEIFDDLDLEWFEDFDNEY